MTQCMHLLLLSIQTKSFGFHPFVDPEKLSTQKLIFLFSKKYRKFKKKKISAPNVLHTGTQSLKFPPFVLPEKSC